MQFKTISGGLALATMLSGGFVASANAAAFAFTDTFGGGSTVQGTSNPSGNTTSYDEMSSKTGNTSIAAGDLHFGIVATTGGVANLAARFTTTPIVLSQIGDTITFQYTFTNGPVTVTQFGNGLYNSGGTVPYTDLNGTNLLGGAADATGGTAGWVGYVQNYQATKTLFQTRPAQTAANSQSQELVVNSFSGSQGYLGQTQVGSTSTSSLITLAASTQYTEVLNVTLGSAGTVLTTSIFGGNVTTGTPLATLTTTDASNLYNTFDSLAIGYGEKTGAIASTIDISALSITAQTGGVTSPEPASLGLLGLAGVGLLRRRKA